MTDPAGTKKPMSHHELQEFKADAFKDDSGRREEQLGAELDLRAEEDQVFAEAGAQANVAEYLRLARIQGDDDAFEHIAQTQGFGVAVKHLKTVSKKARAKADEFKRRMERQRNGR